MVSACAFASVFASNGQRARLKKARPWYSSTVMRLRKGNKLSDALHDLNNLPTIPSATLSGMRTLIGSSKLGLRVDDLYKSSDRKFLSDGPGRV